MSMFIDDEIKQDLYDSFCDLYNDVEESLISLQNGGSDVEFNKLFRAIHNVKGNATLINLDNIVSFTHALEEVAGSLRVHRYPISQPLCEIILISMDRLKDLHQRDIFDYPFDGLQEDEIKLKLYELSQCNKNNVSEAANSTLTFLGYADKEPLPVDPEELDKTQQAIEIVLNDEKYRSDLQYFQELALLSDNQSHYWRGRSIQIFEWAMKTNSVAGNIVPYEQFAAAIYLHDLGMPLLPSHLLHKSENLDDEETALYQQHPKWVYEFLKRIPGWQEAANIVLDHQERVDGKGYPNGKTSQDIHPGAKILAIIDAFFAYTQVAADQKQRKSVIRALSEINSHVDTRFDAHYVQCFISMIRQDLKDGLL